ncbi:MAG: hypothetical protein IKN14_00650 [Clostridiales bacterium]|nr:hypothetical protein [Clostridiales bacterium]
MKKVSFEKYELSPTAYRYYQRKGDVFFEDEDGCYYEAKDSSGTDPTFLGSELWMVDDVMSFCEEHGL